MTTFNQLKKTLSSTAGNFSNGIYNVYLSIPQDVDESIVSSFKSLIDAAKTLGITIHTEDKKPLKTAHDAIAVTTSLLTVTDKGIALSAEHLDSFIQNFSSSGITAVDIGSKVGQGKTLLSAVNSILNTVFAGINLNELTHSENKKDIEVAKGAIGVVSKTIETTINSFETIEKFSDAISTLGSYIQNAKGLSGLSSALKKVPDFKFGHTTTALDGINGILGGISAGLILGDPEASSNKKIAAGFELTNQVIGNTAKTVSQILLAQRIASGASLTGPAAGLIASSVSLAISPLAFYGVSQKFEYAKEITKIAEKFKHHNYEGDNILSSFYKEYGAVDASVTTINTVIGGVSAGVSATAASSVVGAPVALFVSIVSGIVTGILEASKQSMFESVANKYQNKILDWEAQNPGQNYFDHGYGSRYSYLLKENLNFLNELASMYQKESLVVVTQQAWDKQIGELAAVTKLGDKISSGKVFADAIENGNILKGSKEVKINASEGVINLSSSRKSQALVFVTPLLSATDEKRIRKKTGKNEYLSEIRLGKARGWVINDKGNTSTVADFTNVVQRIVFHDGVARNVSLSANLGHGNDVVYISEGESIVDGGEGIDTVSYTKHKGQGVTFSAIDGISGNYSIERNVFGNVYREKIFTQTERVGKRTEKIQYRDAVLENDHYHVTDKLLSIEKVIGSEWNDRFIGGNQSDNFSGWHGNDRIEGNGGDDYLSGGAGRDSIFGGDGNDILSGGPDNDTIWGGSGNDTYIYRKGDGIDYITDNSGTNDLLILDSIHSNEISFARNNLDLEINFNQENKITIMSWFYENELQSRGYHNVESSTNYKIEAIVTSDARVISSDKIDALISAMSSFKVKDVSISDQGMIFDDTLTQKFASSSLI
ncbi:TPA: hypothetical protein OMI62_004768 [Escherichia coli]|nr:hypothetical protein [Escherichia coli]HCQ9044442.1 hypothetical protein [Escherichia coli]